MHALASLLFLAVGGSAFLALGYLTLRSSVGTIALLLAMWIVTVALRDSVDLSLTVSGFRISALDVFSVVLVVVGVARGLSLGVRTVGRGLAFCLLLLLVFHIARGVVDFGVQSAVNDARGWLYFTAGLVYAATIPGGSNRRTWTLVTAAGALLTAVAVPYLLIDGVHPASQMIFRNGGWVTARPIVATGALVILQSAILAPAVAWPSKRAAVYLAIAAGIVVVLLEHRTLWVVGLVVGLVGFIRWSNRRVGAGDTAAFAAIGVVLLLLPLAAWGFTRTGSLVTSAKETTSANSTFAWRTTSWRELVSSHHSISQLVAGEPSGTSWNRVINGHVADESPHDIYVDAYLRFGLPGVAIIFSLGLLLWRRRASVAAESGLTSEAVGLLLLTQLLYGITYTLDPVQGVIDGILVSGLVAGSVARAPAEALLRPRRPEYGLAQR